MRRINEVTPITAGSLVALVLLSHYQPGIRCGDVIKLALRLGRHLRDRGARIAGDLLGDDGNTLRESRIVDAISFYVRSRITRVHEAGSGLLSPLRRRMPQGPVARDATLIVTPENRIKLNFAKNQLVHWLAADGLVALAIASTAQPRSPVQLRQEASSLIGLMAGEFSSLYGESPQETTDVAINRLVSSGLLAMRDATIQESDDQHQAHHPPLALLRGAVRAHVEGYAVSAATLPRLLRGAMGRKDFVARALRQGEQLYLTGKILHNEAVQTDLINSAIDAFSAAGYLESRSGNIIALAETFRSKAALGVVQARLGRFIAT